MCALVARGGRLTPWLGIAFCGGGLIGWVGGYCYGWLMGTKDTERRWSEAVGRADDAREKGTTMCRTCGHGREHHNMTGLGECYMPLRIGHAIPCCQCQGFIA